MQRYTGKEDADPNGVVVDDPGRCDDVERSDEGGRK